MSTLQLAPVAGHALPYCIIKISEDFKSAKVATDLVYAEEKKLEVRYRSKLANYQWLQNGQEIKDDKQYSGSSSPILYVASDINMDGCSFSCKNTECFKSLNHNAYYPQS